MENFLVSIIASIIVVFRNIFRVIQDPYKTMREIAKDHDILQVYIIVTGCIAYFIYASSVRFRTIDPLITTPSALSAFITFVCTFALSIVYIQFLSRRLGIEQRDSTSSLLSLSAYSLVPTLLWFYITSTFYLLLPPPRHATFLGIGFSIVFIVYSCTFLAWRLMMLYMTIRFSFKASFWQVLTIMTAYLLTLLPYSYVLYKIGLFRVPFI